MPPKIYLNAATLNLFFGVYEDAADAFQINPLQQQTTFADFGAVPEGVRGLHGQAPIYVGQIIVGVSTDHTMDLDIGTISSPSQPRCLDLIISTMTSPLHCRFFRVTCSKYLACP